MNSISKLAAGATLLGLTATWSPDAEARFVFPYNHPELDWYTIETEHFFVHYPKSKVTAEDGNPHYVNAEWSARKSAAVAEEMWAPMCAEFNYFLKEKVHIVILDQSDNLEGFTIPSWDWVEVSANPGGYFYRMRGRMEWFSDVLVHEFAHVVSLKANSTFGEGSSGVLMGGLYQDGIRNTGIGVDLYLGDGEPFWWTEGGAEYWSDNTGYNWWTSSRDMNIRTTVLEDRLLTYDEWMRRANKRDWGDGERGYQQGYSIALYLRERFGDETFARFALEYGKGWRPNWETVVEDVLGVDAATLYNDWVAFLTAKYEGMYDKVKAEGEVAGHELVYSPGGWEYSDPNARDEWLGKKPSEREDEREATGTWALEPHYSADGKWYGLNDRGAISIKQIPEDAFYPFSGEYLSDAETLQVASDMSYRYRTSFGHGWSFVPGQDAIVVSGREDLYESAFAENSNLKPEFDGYEWKELWFIKLQTYDRKDKDREYTSLAPPSRFERLGKGATMRDETAAFPIPNTKRGTEPSVSPDGKKIAFFEYADGTLNLATINLDGTEKKLLTNFHDGSWLQRVDWSPDGTQLVASVFRNFQNDLWIFDATGETAPRALTWDSLESFDAHWAADGRIYFSSDPGGIFNIFSYDPETDELLQLTNVIGGAQQPEITPDGNLIFVNFTAHGFKIWGLDKDEFMNKDARHLFNLDIDEELATAAWEYQETFEGVYDGATTKYRWTHGIMPPTAAPIFRYSNDSLTSWGIEGGFYIYAQDFVEKHIAYLEVMVGQDLGITAQYINQTWYPNIVFVARHMEMKFDFAYGLDNDNDASTTDDVEIYEGKNAQVANIAAAFVTYPWNSRVFTSMGGQVLSYGFKGTADKGYDPFMVTGSLFGAVSYQTISDYYRSSANPPPGRTVDLSYTRGFTDIVYKDYYGVDVDDGELLDAYQFNQFDLGWNEHFAVRPIGGFDPLGLLGLASKHSHRFQLGFQGGFIDRNVQFNDEYRAGGRHPYFWGSDALSPNTSFSGYPASAIAGETMLMLHAAYRFPLVGNINKKIGPMYLYGIHGQIMGTAGNAWSYRPPTEPGSYYTNRYDARIAYNEDEIVREIPFKDYSYKNSPVDPATGEIDPNYLLWDLGAEVRVSSTLFRGNWNSFLRLAYGFNEIRGVGDVNGDDVTNTADSTLGDSLSSESELPGLRVYLGLGTGW